MTSIIYSENLKENPAEKVQATTVENKDIVSDIELLLKDFDKLDAENKKIIIKLVEIIKFQQGRIVDLQTIIGKKNGDLETLAKELLKEKERNIFLMKEIQKRVDNNSDWIKGIINGLETTLSEGVNIKKEFSYNLRTDLYLFNYFYIGVEEKYDKGFDTKFNFGVRIKI